VICATEFNGPTISVESLQVKVGKRAFVRAKIMRNGGPHRGSVKLELQAQPGSGRLDPDCALGVNSNSEGIAECGYTAPDKPIVETVIAKAYDEETRGTITVTPPSIVVGFINGVWNTEKQAQDGLAAIKDVVGPTRGDVQLRYERFYNQTGRSNGNTQAQDIAETFIQRSNELDGVLADRWEHYWELLSGRHRSEGSFTQRLLDGLRNGASALSDLIDSALSSMLAGFVKGLSQLMSNPPTAVDMAAHLSRLQAMADEGSDFVLVAHSQGNLFVNIAHDALRDSRPETKRAVVHVAPASPTTRGEYVMADIDLVINGLRNFGYDSVKPYNFWIFGGRAPDWSGHTLVDTYLDGQREASIKVEGRPKTTARAQVKGLIVEALDRISGP
jgi:hypothetical protein